MTLSELRAQFRVEADDEVIPYLWTDAQVSGWLNEAQEEAAERASLLPEESDDGVCNVAVTAGANTYPLHEAILDITRAAFTPTGGSTTSLYLTDRVELDRIRPDWRTSTDEPAYIIQDDTKARIVPTPALAGVLSLECHRLPLIPMEYDEDTPEIARAHHRHLVNWALFRAFSKPDSEIIDASRAVMASSAFTTYFGIRPDAQTRKDTRANRPHHNKSVW